MATLPHEASKKCLMLNGALKIQVPTFALFVSDKHIGKENYPRGEALGPCVVGSEHARLGPQFLFLG